VRADDVVDRFQRDGIVRLDGAFTADQASAIGDTVWRHVERRSDTRRSDPATWATKLQITFKPLKGKAVFAPLVDNAAVEVALDAIFGPNGWRHPRAPGAQILLTMPTAGPWVLPAGWHMDCGYAQPTWPVFAVKLFAFFDEVEAEGGGTLLLSGSHRLVERYAKTLPSGTGGNGVTWGRFMKQDPWLNELRRGGTPEEPGRHLLDTEHEVDGIPLRAVELTGSPGDVIITHLHVFHTADARKRHRRRYGVGTENSTSTRLRVRRDRDAARISSSATKLRVDPVQLTPRRCRARLRSATLLRAARRKDGPCDLPG
jgi:hypothetical protein